MLGPGDHFGEIALRSPTPLEPATITAETDLVCYGMTVWDFRGVVDANSSIAWKLLVSRLARRRRRRSRTASRLTGPRPPERPEPEADAAAALPAAVAVPKIDAR